MKGDFSRLTFDPDKAFTQVLRQQGRVDVDADWNEQQAILTHLDRTTRADIIGPAGAPLGDDGFAITLPGGVPEIGAGHFYVGGQFVDLAEDTPLNDQPYSAGLPLFLDTDGTPVEVPPDGRYLFFLEAWDYHVTAVEDQDLRELALGGPDTTTRVKTVWRVRALRLGAAGGTAHCETITPAWTDLITPPDGTLAARARAVPPVTNLCALPEQAGYQSLDHRHYYVEAHDPGGAGTATWKWSRDTAAFVARWLARNGNELTVSTTGFDAHIGFRNGGWIELTSDTRELAGLPGTLVRVDRVAGDVLEVDTATATGSLNLASFGDNPKIRAWDSAGALDLTTGSFLALENGVEVEFGAGTYETGDYWMIPARSGVGVLWPEDGGTPVARTRFGTDHRFARLALLDFEANVWTHISDCRPLFPAATELMTLDVLGGDAQEIMPDPADTTALLPLRQPLQVGVARGIHPVANAQVRFRVTAGGGELTGGPNDVTIATDADGRAEIDFALDSTTLDQTVEARLVSPGGHPRHLRHTFTARLSRASEVSFDPVNCPPLAGDRTVQAAIERLCQTGAQGCATYILSPDADWQAVLLGLEAGENAHICFQRGTYITEQRLEMRGLGHIQLSGCGQGSQIIAEGPECALFFEDCASLKVTDLAFASPQNSDPDAPIPDINGVLTASRCGEVEVHGTTFLTGASARDDRACLTIRQTRGGRAETVTQRVVVTGNHFDVGNGQTGVLITDAGVVHVAQNRISGAGTVDGGSGGGGGGGGGPVIENPGFTAGISNRLVGSLVHSGGEAPVAGQVMVSAGAFTGRFSSSIEEEDWQRAVRSNPPTEAELANTQTFGRYIDRVAGTIAANPQGSPSYFTLTEAIRVATREEEIPEETARTLLLGEEAVQIIAASPETTGRNVTVTVREHRVSFNSELDQGDWNRMIASVQTSGVNSDTALEQVVRETSNRLIAEEDFRNQFTFTRAYFDSLVARTAAVAGKGIVCAGNMLAEVHVTANSMTRVYEGIRVAVSHASGPNDPPDMVGSVAISDNRVTLALPVSASRGDQGILVGNAERVMVSGNEVMFDPVANDPLYGTGIELWGHYGPQVYLRENTVQSAEAAIRFTVEQMVFDPDRPPLWRAVANLSINGGIPAFVFRTEPDTPGGPQPAPFIQRDNIRV